MQLDAALQIAQSLLTDWRELFAWKIEVSGRLRRTLGRCCHFRQVIQLSRYFLLLNDRTLIIEVVMHEIAHALVGAGHAHDAAWQAKAIELGITPQRFYQNAVMPTGKYVAIYLNELNARQLRRRGSTPSP